MRYWGLVLCFTITLLLVNGCDRDRDRDENDVIIRNYTDDNMLIYLNGLYQFRMVDGEVRRIRDVSDGRYLIEAKTESLLLFQAATFKVRDGRDFYFVIRVISPVDEWGNLSDWGSDIRVYNRTDYDLHIYLNNVYQFFLAPYSQRYIDNVPTGYHLIEARRVWGLTFQANTIYVASNLEDYYWEVRKR